MRKYDKKYVKKKEVAVKDLSFLIGAKVISVEPHSNVCGYYWTDEIEDITIETIDGSKLSIQVGGRRHNDIDEDHYIELYTVLDEDT